MTAPNGEGETSASKEKKVAQGGKTAGKGQGKGDQAITSTQEEKTGQQ